MENSNLKSYTALYSTGIHISFVQDFMKIFTLKSLGYNVAFVVDNTYNMYVFDREMSQSGWNI